MKYTVNAVRDGDAWTVRVEEIDCVTQALTVDEIELMTRDLIEIMTGDVDPKLDVSVETGSAAPNPGDAP